MATKEALIGLINGKKTETFFSQCYGTEKNVIETQKQRYTTLLGQFERKFDSTNEMHLFSTSGRTEVGGNHTDHNFGRVLAASVSVDSIAFAAPTGDTKVTIYSEGFDGRFLVDLANLEPVTDEEGTTNALIRGVAARFKQLGYRIGGFNAYMTSNVLRGSGLSSSASIEVLLGNIMSELFNNGIVTPQDLGIIGQYAENEFFGKPCGLMDQMACAVGGLVAIDFKNPVEPVVEKVTFDFAAQDYSLVVVDTGGNHADLTPDYAAIPFEMKSVAEFFGETVCRNITKEQMIAQLAPLRKKVGDRAVLRAFHFLGDNERVTKQVAALKANDFDTFLSLITESGNSSWKQLQNCYSTINAHEQGITVALAVTEDYLQTKNIKGACRVHGGGFAGTIQIFIPTATVEDYAQKMDGIFGQGAATVLGIRPYPTVCIDRELGCY
jgi:galactokinase